MSIPNTIIPGVHEKSTIAPDVPTFGSGIGANTAAGGEVRVNDYQHRRTAPPPAKPYRDLND